MKEKSPRSVKIPLPALKVLRSSKAQPHTAQQTLLIKPEHIDWRAEAAESHTELSTQRLLSSGTAFQDVPQVSSPASNSAACLLFFLSLYVLCELEIKTFVIFQSTVGHFFTEWAPVKVNNYFYYCMTNVI